MTNFSDNSPKNVNNVKFNIFNILIFWFVKVKLEIKEHEFKQKKKKKKDAINTTSVKKESDDDQASLTDYC